MWENPAIYSVSSMNRNPLCAQKGCNSWEGYTPKNREMTDMTREEQRAWQALARAAKRVREIQGRRRAKPAKGRRKKGASK
jgi:hypothetical protein